MEKFMQLLAGQTFQIEKNWGLSYINEIFLQKSLGASNADLFSEMKMKSKSVDFFGPSGNALGQLAYEDVPAGSIARITLDGPMMVNDGLCSIGMRSLDNVFRAAYANPAVKGILFEVNSGGGQSAAGDILMNTMKDRNKPVVVYTTMLGSAALKGTLPADEIIAAGSQSIIGSIGVMYSVDKSIVEYAKENTIDIYASTSPNKNKAWRELKEGKFEEYIKMADRLDTLFMSDVKKYRPLKGTEAMIENTLSGEIFDGNRAKYRGLVDGIGSINYALKRLNSHLSY